MVSVIVALVLIVVAGSYAVALIVQDIGRRRPTPAAPVLPPTATPLADEIEEWLRQSWPVADDSDR